MDRFDPDIVSNAAPQVRGNAYTRLVAQYKDKHRGPSWLLLPRSTSHLYSKKQLASIINGCSSQFPLLSLYHFLVPMVPMVAALAR